MIILPILTTSLIHVFLKGWENVFFERASFLWPSMNLRTKKGRDHQREWSTSNFPCSPTRNITSLSIENLAFHRLRKWRWLFYQFSLPHLYISLWKVGQKSSPLTISLPRVPTIEDASAVMTVEEQSEVAWSLRIKCRGKMNETL